MTFKPRKIHQLLYCSLTALFSYLTLYSTAYAAPQGGQIVGGGGSINQAGLTTNIQQNTQNLAINWNSYNLNSNEIVNYLQPNSSSIALNRVLGGSASQIFGQINANGQVVLVNPNGVFIGQNASVNVGGLIASGLDIDPIDFMNGNYLFNAIDGTDGVVVNSGLINASLGGNVGLLGKQVENEGVISAQLGSVVLAAGKEAILTFDNDGMIGVQVTQAMLQEDIGIDPAVLNSGEINAGGGRVLLTASVSQDVFSNAVNHNGIEQATSVVVHEDGSFTLGGGADVVNHGNIDVSASGDTNAGAAVLLGENIDSSGSIRADSEQGQAGFIELHASDTTELTDSAKVSAQATQKGQGGQIQVLGDKVGLFDQAEVNADGVNGGGEILIGGDQQGQNAKIRNADFIYLGKETEVSAGATDDGQGGTIITYANNTARIYGSLSAAGGQNGGDGGFIETSGKVGFDIQSAPDVSAVSGSGGTWLIDPNNISIVSGNGNENINNTSPFETTDDGALLGVGLIVTALSLANGVTVTITTLDADADNSSSPTPGVGTEPGDITLLTNLDYNGIGTGDTLELYAEGDIIISDGYSIGENIGVNGATNDESLSIGLYANGAVSIGVDASITTQGGDFTVAGWTGSSVHTVDSFNNLGTIDTTGLAGDGSDDGSIDITTTQTTDFTIRGMTVGAGNLTVTTGRNIVQSGVLLVNGAGAVLSLTAGNAIDGWGDIDLSTPQNDFNIFSARGKDVKVYDKTSIDLGESLISNNLTVVAGAGISNSGAISVTKASVFNAANLADGSVELNNTENSFGGSVKIIDGYWDTNPGASITSVTIFDTSDLLISLEASTSNSGTNLTNLNLSGDLTVTSTGALGQSTPLLVSGVSSFTVNNGAINLLSNDNDFQNTVSLVNTGGGSVQITDSNGIQLGASDISGNLSVTAVTGNITDIGNASTDTSLIVHGTADFRANQNNASIILDGTGSNYTGDVSFLSNSTLLNVTIVDNSAFAIQSTGLTLDGDLNITSDGTLSQTTSVGGELTIGGDTYLDARNGSITLLNSANDFGTVSLNNSDNSAVQIYDENNIDLAASTINGSLNVHSHGQITQSGALDITLTSSFTSNTGSINLSNINNDFQQAVSLITPGKNDDVTIYDINSIELGLLDISRDLTVVAYDGNITSSGAIDVDRNASFTANGVTSKASSIEIGNFSNDFTDTVSLNGTNLTSVTIYDTTSLELPSLNLTTLTVTSGDEITQGSSTLTVSGTSSFSATNAITLDNNNDFGGAVSLTNSNTASIVAITDSNDIVLGASNIAGHLSIVSGGDITDIGSAGSPADISVGGTTSLQVINGAQVILDSPGSNYGGDLSIIFDGAEATLSNVTVDDNSSFVIQALDTSNNVINLVLSGALDIISNGDITQNSILNVTGASSFNSGNGAITLEEANIFQGTVSLTTIQHADSTTYNASIINTGAIDFESSNISGDLTAEASGEITQSNSLTVTGASSFDAGANAITLLNASNDFVGAVSLNNTGSNNVQVLDSNGIDLGTSRVGGNLTVTSETGDITDSGDVDTNADIVVAGDASFIANALNASILLDSTNSDYQGTIRFSGTGGLLNVTIDNDSALNFQELTLTGSLTASSDGSIAQSGVLNIGGTSYFDAGANAITLDLANDFIGVVSLNNTGANNAEIYTSNAIDLGFISVGGDLTVTANNGDITDNGTSTITVGGSASFTSNVSSGTSSILLDNAGSNYVGNVSFIGSNLENVIVVDSSDLQIQGFTLAGFLDVTSDGDITQGGVLNIGGAASFNAGNGAITLEEANNFQGTVSLMTTEHANSTTYNASIKNTGAIDFESSNISGDLTAVASGEITQSNSLIVTGASSFNAGANAITLLNASNDFVGAVSLNNTGSNAVQVADIDSIDMGLSDIGGDLYVSAAGDITDSAKIVVGGNTYLETTALTASSITLDSIGNEFGDVVSFIDNGNGFANITLNDASALALQVVDNYTNSIVQGRMSLSGGLSVISNGNITQNSGLVVSGVSSFNAGNGEIVLENTSNDFQSTVSLITTEHADSTTYDASIVVSNAIELGASDVSGNLIVKSLLGNITDSGDAITDTRLIVRGDASFIADEAGASIILDGTGSNYHQSVSFSGAGGLLDVIVVDSSALELLTLDLDGSLNVTSNGALTQAVGGTLLVGGASSFNAGSGAITLANTGNDFVGPVSLFSTGTGAVRIDDMNALVLGASDIGGSLEVNAQGAISNTGVVTVSGNSIFNATGFDIDLANNGNDFSSISLDGANVAVSDANGIILGTVLATGTLDVTTNDGSIYDSGDIEVTGNSIFTANAPSGTSSIILDSTGSIYAGSMSFLGANLTNVTVVDNSALDLQNLTLAGDLSATSAGALTQSGLIAVDGNAEFIATGYDITLANQNNDFNLVSFDGTNVQVSDSSGLKIGASNITGTLTVSANGDITQNSVLSITGASSFDAGSGGIDLSTHQNDFGGAVSLYNSGSGVVRVTDTNSILLSDSVIAGSLVVTAAGDVTQNDMVSVTGSTTINATGYDIDLTNVGNNFSSIGFNGVNVAVTDGDDIDLAESMVTGTFEVESIAGSISNSGDLTVSGDATFTANTAGSSIVLNSPGNSFVGKVSFVSSGGLGSVSIVDTTSLILHALNLTGDLYASSGGQLTQTGPLTVEGTANFVATGYDITLDNDLNNFNTITMDGRNLVVKDADNIDLGTLTASGDLSVTTVDGSISDSGPIDVTGDAFFTANAPDDGLAGGTSSIVLDDPGSIYHGSVSLEGTNLSAVTIVDNSELDLGTLNLSGNLSATSVGALTQSGVLQVDGNADFNATGFDITLDNGLNDFTSITLSGANVVVKDANDIELGTLTASGDMYVTTVDGSISDSGPIDVSGDAFFTANAPDGGLAGGTSSIVLDDPGSIYRGSVSLQGTNLSAVTIVDNSELDLGTLKLSGNLSATSVGALTQSGVLQVGGNADFNATGYDITLTDPANDFKTITLVGQNVAVTDANSITLGTLTATGTMDVTVEDGSITDSGTIDVTGAAVFTANAPVGGNAGGTSSIVLDDPNSIYRSSVSLLGENLDNVTIVDNSPLELHTLNLSGDLSATSAGDLTQSGVLTVGQNADFLATGYDITLTDPANDFKTITLVGQNVAVTDANSINLGTLTATGTMGVTVEDGSITDSGTIDVTGAAIFTANAPNGGNAGGTSSIVLDNPNSIYRSSVSLLGENLANVTIVDNSPLQLGNLSLNGDLSATSAGALTQSDTLIVGGNADFIAPGFNITLLGPDNDFNTVTLEGIDVKVFDVNGLILGVSEATGDLAVTANNGDIRQSGTLTVGDMATFIAEGNDIVLLNDANQFSSVSLTARNAELNDVDGLIFGASSITNDLTVKAHSDGDVSQDAAITVGGMASFSTDGGDVDLGNDLNEFATVNVVANNATLSDANSIFLGASTVTSNLSVVANSDGDIEQNGDLSVGGLASFTAVGDDIILGNVLNEFATVAVNAANATLSDANGILLGASTVATNLTVTANSNGDIGQSGVLNVGGLALFTAAGDDVDLGNDSNQFAEIGVTARNAIIADADSIDLATSTLANDLTVRANGDGDIGQTAAVAVEGVATLLADGNRIDLGGNNANDFSTVLLTANSANLIDANGFTLGASSLSSGLIVEALNGDVLQADNSTITVGGPAQLTASGGIRLDQSGNDFSSVQLDASYAHLADANDIEIAASNVTGDLSITALGSGSIKSQPGVISVGGLARFLAAGNTITLTDSENRFSYLALEAANAFITEFDGFRFSTTNIDSNLTVTAAGSIGQVEAVSVGGMADLNANGYDITLTQAENDFATILLDANNVTLIDNNNIELGTSNITGNLSLTANNTGDINQSGALEVAGDATFVAEGDDITLNNSGNDLNTVSLVAHDVTLIDTNSLILNASTLTGDLKVSIENAGSITQGGALSVVGNSSFDVNGGQSISLGNTSNLFQGSLSLASNTAEALLNVDVANNAALDLGTIDVSNNMGFVANGAITNSGVLSSGGIAGFDAKGHVITLNNSGNDFNHLVIVNASSASVTDINGIQIGSADSGSAFSNISSSVAGDLNITALNGSITDEDSVGLSVAGLASFNAGSQDIVLNSVNNDFATVNFVSAQNVNLADSDAVDLQSGLIAGDLVITAGSDITSVNGSLIVDGNSSFTTGPNDSVLLTHTNNSFGGELTFAASSGTLHDVSVVNAQATTFSGIEVGNNLSIQSAGAITQNGLFDVANNTTLDAGSAAIILEANNNLNGLTIWSADQASINNVSEILTVSGIQVTNNLDLSAVSLEQSGIISTQSGDISLDLTGGLNMSSGSSIISALGNIQTTVNDSAGVAGFSAANGDIVLTTGGAITDNNGDGSNFHGDTLVLRSVSGIGRTGAIDTSVKTLDIINSTEGAVNLNQSGEVRLTSLQNNGNINFESNRNIYFNPGSTISAMDTGDLQMSTSTGSFYGLGDADKDNPDITARNATFIGLAGTFGNYNRYLTLKVPGVVIIQTRGVFSPQFVPPLPTEVYSEGIDFSILGAISAIAGEQLVEIETLSEIDPAIFTALRNYSFKDISIRMPRDQLYEDELDEQDVPEEGDKVSLAF